MADNQQLEKMYVPAQGLFPQQRYLDRVCIVIPTYNEAQNITLLLDEIFANHARFKEQGGYADLFVLIVDDNSPDGTAKVIQQYREKNKHVLLLLREKKEGLGAAYIAGMKYALEIVEPDIVFEMDGDHSHNPQDIFRMIDTVRSGSDFVIGSRYIEGGGVPDNWGFHRKVLSFCASTVSRYGMGLGAVQDCSGGFRAIRADVLRSIDLDDLDVKGYAFQIVLLESVIHSGYKVKEIPITFNERKTGTSKMRFSDMLEGWSVIFKVRTKRVVEAFSS